jgi:hypothetical protein
MCVIVDFTHKPTWLFEAVMIYSINYMVLLVKIVH